MVFFLPVLSFRRKTEQSANAPGRIACCLRCCMWCDCFHTCHLCCVECQNQRKQQVHSVFASFFVLTACNAGPREHFIRCFTLDGFLKLHYVEWGDVDSANLVICCHGLTRAFCCFHFQTLHLNPDCVCLCCRQLSRFRFSRAKASCVGQSRAVRVRYWPRKKRQPENKGAM